MRDWLSEIGEWFEKMLGPLADEERRELWCLRRGFRALKAEQQLSVFVREFKQQVEQLEKKVERFNL